MEENLYDTSKLIEYYREKKDVRGFTTILNLIEFPKALKFNLKVVYPTKSDYELALRLSMNLIEKGKHISAVDAVIAAIAINNNLTLITGDKHFQFVKDFFTEKFKVLIE